MSLTIAQAPRSRRGWLEAAERAELSTLFGQPLPEIETEDGQFSALMVTLGPKYYARRVHERFAEKNGFVVMDIRRDGRCMNPITGETNTVYKIRSRAGTDVSAFHRWPAASRGVIINLQEKDRTCFHFIGSPRPHLPHLSPTAAPSSWPRAAAICAAPRAVRHVPGTGSGMRSFQDEGLMRAGPERESIFPVLAARERTPRFVFSQALVE